MSRVTTLDRRTVLRGGLVVGVAVAGLGAVSVSGCSTGPSEETITAERLTPLVRSALADEKSARAIVPAEAGYAAALTVVADQRAEHARALREEIIRLDQDVATTLDQPAPSTSPAPATPPTLVGFRTDLERSSGEARDVAISLSGYPAGLVGSVAAAVTSMREVQLA
ncbi:hypothetical protein RD149_03420 [Gordonia westfalica]|uniref:DUF4439 domain-containing protein n=1 Tax=Gordonia westfalica TaxID=158898 RepID=A0ABU2GMY1_9ACTN|nr:hypothetical protein [Gordonia westfalica]MDS1112808.1 hypothetical protein [Gordonia westfalica]